MEVLTDLTNTPVAMLDSTPSLKDASLLGLPRELRLVIYEYVLELDLDYKAINRWRHTYTTAARGFRDFPELNLNTSLVVPWISLMLSCKPIASEIRAYMSDSASELSEGRTYVLDVEAMRGGMELGPATWRRLPCAPNHARCLIAYYDASRGLKTWGDGGPHGITSGLYQTLNHVLHCGPRFDSKFELSSPMHLQELKIIVENRGHGDENDESSSDEESGVYASPERTMITLGSVVGQFVRTGVLRGFVDKIEVSAGDKTLHWSPEESEGEGIPEYWKAYGFDWGMEIYRNSK